MCCLLPVADIMHGWISISRIFNMFSLLSSRADRERFILMFDLVPFNFFLNMLVRLYISQCNAELWLCFFEKHVDTMLLILEFEEESGMSLRRKFSLNQIRTL